MAAVTVSQPYYMVGGTKVLASQATPAQKEQAIAETRASIKTTTTPASTSKGVTVSEAYYTVGGQKVPASQATELQKQQAIAESRPAASQAWQASQPKTSGVTVSEPYYTVSGQRVPAAQATGEQVAAAERGVAVQMGVPERTVQERYGIVEFAGEQQPFAIGEGAPPESRIVAAPVTVTTTEFAQSAAERMKMQLQAQTGQEYYMFREGAVPSDVVPVTTIKSTTETVTKKPSGEYVTYAISPSAFTVQEPGKPAVTTFAPPGQEYNLYTFLGEAKKKGATIEPSGQGYIVKTPVMTTEVSTAIGAKEGYVITRKATEGEQWVQLGRERMQQVEQYPVIKQLGQLAEGIISVPSTLTSKMAAITKFQGVKFGVETMGGVVTAATAGAVSPLKLPEFGTKVAVGAATMAQQAVTSPESFKVQVGETAKVAPVGVAVVGGLVATQAIESVKADPRNVLYAGAYLAGAYVGTAAAIQAAQKGATYVSGGVKTLGRSITEVTGRSAVGETTGITSAKGVTSAGFQKVPYELSGTVKSVPSGVPGMSAYETTGVIRGEYSGLLRSSQKFIEFREQGLISGLKPGELGGVELGQAAALPARAGAAVPGTGLYYFSLSKGVQAIPTEATYIPFMKAALSKELSSLPAIEVGAYTYPATTTYFSYGVQAGMAGQRSTISELGTIITDVLPSASTGGGAGGAIVLGGGGSATVLGGGGGGTVTQLTTQLQAFMPPPSIGAQATQQLVTFAAAEQAKELSTYAAGGAALTKTMSTMAAPATYEQAGTTTSMLMMTEPARTFRPPSTFTMTEQTQTFIPSTMPATPVPSGMTMQKVMGGTVTRAAEETLSLQRVGTSRAEQRLVTQPQMTRQFTEGVTISALESLGMETTEEVSRTMTLEGVTSMQMTETVPVMEQVTESMFMQAAPTMTIMPPPTIIPTVFPSLDFGGGRAERDMLGARPRQPRKYQPSLTAIALDIHAKPSKKLLTGLELRPLPPAPKGRKKVPFGGMI